MERRFDDAGQTAGADPGCVQGAGCLDPRTSSPAQLMVLRAAARGGPPLSQRDSIMLRLNLKLVVAAAALAAPIAYSTAMLVPPAKVMHEPEMIALASGNVTYRPAGDFARVGKPVAAPFKTAR